MSGDHHLPAGGRRDGATWGSGRFEVRGVPIAGSDPQALTAQIQANVDHYFGPGQVVSVRVVGAIPRTAEGKLKDVVFDPDDFVLTPTS